MRQKSRIKNVAAAKTVVLATALAAFGGAAASTNFDDFMCDLRSVATNAVFQSADLEGTALTSREFTSEYKVVYADDAVASYLASDFAYTGGANGSVRVRAGTIDRKTGRRLSVADVVPAVRRAEALSALRKAVVAKIGGEDQLLGDVDLVENFYIARDGLHFVFGECEVACHAAGVVDVVLPGFVPSSPRK